MRIFVAITGIVCALALITRVLIDDTAVKASNAFSEAPTTSTERQDNTDAGGDEHHVSSDAALITTTKPASPTNAATDAMHEEWLAQTYGMVDPLLVAGYAGYSTDALLSLVDEDDLVAIETLVRRYIEQNEIDKVELMSIRAIHAGSINAINRHATGLVASYMSTEREAQEATGEAAKKAALEKAERYAVDAATYMELAILRGDKPGAQTSVFLLNEAGIVFTEQQLEEASNRAAALLDEINTGRINAGKAPLEPIEHPEWSRLNYPHDPQLQSKSGWGVEYLAHNK